MNKRLLELCWIRSTLQYITGGKRFGFSNNRQKANTRRFQNIQCVLKYTYTYSFFHVNDGFNLKEEKQRDWRISRATASADCGQWYRTLGAKHTDLPNTCRQSTVTTLFWLRQRCVLFAEDTLRGRVMLLTSNILRKHNIRQYVEIGVYYDFTGQTVTASLVGSLRYNLRTWANYHNTMCTECEKKY